MDEETTRKIGLTERLENNIAWDFTDLKMYLRYDYWKATDGLAVLAGFRYPYDGRVMDFFVDDEEFPGYGAQCANRYGQLCGVWERSEHNVRESRHLMRLRDIFKMEYSPAYFIEWATSKGLRINWLKWAIERGLYIPKQETENLSPTIVAHVFDEKADSYSQELAAALQAWLAVSATPGKGKPKARIRAWLDAHETYKNLSDEAKDRISILTNWDKRGGATRSD